MKLIILATETESHKVLDSKSKVEVSVIYRPFHPYVIQDAFIV